MARIYLYDAFAISTHTVDATSVLYYANTRSHFYMVPNSCFQGNLGRHFGKFIFRLKIIIIIIKYFNFECGIGGRN